MAYDPQHIARLIFLQLSGTISPEQEQELQAWKTTSEQHEFLINEIDNEDTFAHRLRLQQPQHLEPVAARMLERIASAQSEATTTLRPVHRLHLLKIAWVKYAAAIIIMFGIGAYLWNSQQHKDALVSRAQEPTRRDILPGTDRAILTLSNGQKVELNASGAETISDGQLEIQNDKGQLLYKPNDLVAFNTMTTPKGGQYQLSLSDGSRVWLNAASSITYPTTFKGTLREVSITGEAYFEIAPNKNLPFVVKTRDQTIEVLGTAFNVNAYDDEPVYKTSLVQGSVKVNGSIITPGESFTEGKVYTTDLSQDLAWKNGIFNFHGKNTQEVMRQLSRWYDIEVSYSSTPPSTLFYGKMGRNLQLAKVLEFLEKSGIQFRMESNNKLIVL